MLSRTNGAALLLGIAVGIVLLMVRLQVSHPLSLSQPASYHNFADQRRWLGIPNSLNVASNLPFAVFGIWGIIFITKNGSSHTTFIDSPERWPYLALFVGLFFTAFGSAYYHWMPGNGTLVWDRLPMAIGFGAFIATIVTEKLNVRIGTQLLPFLLAFTIATVLQWYASELHGHGDLRWYAAVQIYSVIVLLVAPFLPARYSRKWDFMIVFAFYAGAKIFEIFDRQIYSYRHIVSGHTLKHLAAATTGYWILRMLQERVPCREEFIAR